MNRPDNSAGPAANAPSRARRRLFIAGSAVVAIAALVAVNTFVFARGGGHHGWGGQMSAEDMSEHLEHGVKYVLSDIDATDQQKAQITAIVQATAQDLHAMHDQHSGGREQLKAILSAATVDRAQLETLRADHVRLADEASKRIVAGLADVADVLTPEQRVALATKMEKRHHRWHREENLHEDEKKAR